ncbi:MAG: transporter substrate-binding domain-containing protein [Bacteroidales bacterium]
MKNLLTILIKSQKTAGFLFLFTGMICLINVSVVGAPDTVKVGIYQNEPKIYMDKSGEPAGIFVDLLNEIAENENWHLLYKPCEWEECLSALQNGDIDLMPDVALTSDRNEKFDFNKTCVIDSWSQLYTKQDSDIEKLTELEGKSIVLLRGSVQENTVKQMMTGFNIDFDLLTVKSYDEGFEMVKNDRADAIITNHFFGDMHYKNSGLEKTPIVFDPVSLYFVTDKGKNPDLLETIDNYLKDWKNKSESHYYDTLGKYMGKTVPQQKSKFPVWIIVAVTGLLLFASCTIIFLRRMINIKTKYIREKNLSLKQERNTLKSYVEYAPFGIMVTDEKGKCHEVNSKVSAITGIPENELENKNIFDMLPGSHHNIAAEHYRRAEADEKASGTYPFINKNEDKRYCTIDTVKISEHRFLSFINDITEQYLAEKERDKLRDKLEKQVAERTSQLNEKINYLNKSQKAMLYMVEDLNNMTKELKDERRKLQFINQELEAFAYSVSHDLRAPLRAINGFSNFLMEDYTQKLDDEGKRYITTIKNNASKMDRLISDLLNLSRVSRAEITATEVNMTETVKSMFHEVASDVEKKAFTLKVDSLPTVKCDNSLMKQVWQNLISNALKYSSKSSKKMIEVWAEETDDDIKFFLKDHGAGFDANYKHKLFKIFQRLHSEEEFEGTGVGLAIIQRIIHRHGGNVWADGKINQGATFGFSMPKG